MEVFTAWLLCRCHKQKGWMSKLVTNCQQHGCCFTKRKFTEWGKYVWVGIRFEINKLPFRCQRCGGRSLHGRIYGVTIMHMPQTKRLDE